MSTTNHDGLMVDLERMQQNSILLPVSLVVFVVQGVLWVTNSFYYFFEKLTKVKPVI
jgi:hypothetical protein